MSTRAILASYYDGLARKSGWEDQVSDTMTYTGANAASGTRGKAAYIEQAARFYGMFESLTVKEMVIGGAAASVVVSYGLVSPAGRRMDLDMAEVWKVRDGKLDALRVYCDTAAITAFMQN